MGVFASVLLTMATAIAGGIVAGAISQFLGRRLTIIVFSVWAAVFIPLWVLPTSFSGLAAGAALIQVGVQGAWGVGTWPCSSQLRPALIMRMHSTHLAVGDHAPGLPCDPRVRPVLAPSLRATV